MQALFEEIGKSQQVSTPIAAIICYDLTVERTFESVSYWLNEMQNNNNNDKYVLALAGNKCDVNQEEWAIKEEHIQTMKSNN